MSRFIDLTGKRYNDLVVIKRLSTSAWGRIRWLCKCNCGDSVVVEGSNLKSGHTKSCGCARKLNNYFHGMSKTRTHKIWSHMIQRCLNPNTYNSYLYSGRGITVCERWKDFEGFYADMGECPEGLTLDRIDNNGNYEPGNCRWATPKEQARNRRSTTKVEYDGMVLTLSEWAERLDIGYRTLYGRIFIYKWPIEKAMTKPVL